jgi:hypothetical protein
MEELLKKEIVVFRVMIILNKESLLKIVYFLQEILIAIFLEDKLMGLCLFNVKIAQNFLLLI